MAETTPMSCVTSTIAVPKSSRRRASSSSACRWTATSSALVGSSASSTAGRGIIAIAMPARWFMPPESSKG